MKKLVDRFGANIEGESLELMIFDEPKFEIRQSGYCIPATVDNRREIEKRIKNYPKIILALREYANKESSGKQTHYYAESILKELGELELPDAKT